MKLKHKVLPILPQAQESDDPSELSELSEARGQGIDSHYVLVDRTTL